MKEFFNKLSDKDRNALIFGGIFIVVLTLYFGVWSPFKNSTGLLSVQVARQTEALAWMKSHQAGAMALQKQTSNKRGQGNRGRSLLSVVDESLRHANLNKNVKRIEPAGEGQINVRFEDAVFDNLVIWLGSLANDQGIVPNTITVVERGGEGLIDAQMVLSR